MAVVVLLGCLQAGVLIAGAAEDTQVEPGDIDIPLVSTTGSTGPTGSTGASCSHTYGDWISVNDSEHERTCIDCSDVERKGHNWNTGTVTKNATCEEAGIKTYACVSCGATKTQTIDKLTTHSYSSSWSSDKNRHWYACTVCGQKNSAATHTPGAAATETTPQSCTVCGYVITPAVGHKHSYQNTWTGDSEGHWYACTSCGSKKDYQAHTYDNTCDTDCNICGTLRADSHTFDEKWTSGRDGHWYTCTACGAKKDIGEHTPGAVATKTTPQTCTVCGYIITPVIGHKHTFANAWTTDTTAHWHSCPGCSEQKAYEEHIFDNACDTNCNTCGYERKTEHIFASDWSMDEAEHWHLCTVCGVKADTKAHEFETAQGQKQLCKECAYEAGTDIPVPTVPDMSQSYETDTGSHFWFNVALVSLIVACVAVLIAAWIVYKKKQQQ